MRADGNNARGSGDLPTAWLRSLSAGTRLGLTFLVLTLFGGYVIASGLHLKEHHQARDGRDGFSLDDLRGAYHGGDTESPLRRALEGGHPADLPPAAQTALLNWLDSESISEDYDNFDLGENAPAELIDVHCLSCHAGKAELGAGIPLEYWDQIERIAFSRSIEATDARVLLASTHAHASTMAAIGIILVLLLAATRWPRAVVGLIATLIGAALLADLGSWWLARDNVIFVPVIAATGAVHSLAATIAMLLVIGDLWRP